ncbi:MAG: YitT family protein [Lachnospiraceae bacterium]|nr:YitT family protein [Lachnospiraceae bacterium]
MERKPFQQLKNLFLVVAGTLILSLGTALFIIPFDLVVGGISSIAIILNQLLSIPFLTTDFLITIVTWSLFFIGLFALGKNFALKTLVSSIVYPLGFSLFSKLADPDVLNGMFCLSQSRYSEIAILLAALFGGVFVGTGCALTFLGGGSTGGVDIFAFIICKLFRKARSSVVIFLIDALTISLGLLVIKDLVISLLGITSAFISAMVVDKIFLGESRAFIAQIVSDQHVEINRLIAEKLERTTSIVEIEGGYSGKKKRMLMISFTMNQYNELINIINQTDSTAFVTIHRAHEINGEGWTR